MRVLAIAACLAALCAQSALADDYVTTTLIENEAADVTNSINEALEDAAAAWSKTIRSEQDPLVMDKDVNLKEFCGVDYAIQADKEINNLLVLVRVVAESELLKDTGVFAQPCVFADADGTYFPRIGVITINAKLATKYAYKGLLQTLVEHEIGHILGIGTLWTEHGLIKDNTYVGSRGIWGYILAGGPEDASSVPTERSADAIDVAHWDEDVFDTELMTGTMNARDMPLSTISINSLRDLGYAVWPQHADEFDLLEEDNADEDDDDDDCSGRGRGHGGRGRHGDDDDEEDDDNDGDRRGGRGHGGRGNRTRGDRGRGNSTRGGRRERGEDDDDDEERRGGRGGRGGHGDDDRRGGRGRRCGSGRGRGRGRGGDDDEDDEHHHDHDHHHHGHGNSTHGGRGRGRGGDDDDNEDHHGHDHHGRGNSTRGGRGRGRGRGGDDNEDDENHHDHDHHHHGHGNSTRGGRGRGRGGDDDDNEDHHGHDHHGRGNSTHGGRGRGRGRGRGGDGDDDDNSERHDSRGDRGNRERTTDLTKDYKPVDLSVPVAVYTEGTLRLETITITLSSVSDDSSTTGSSRHPSAWEIATTVTTVIFGLLLLVIAGIYVARMRQATSDADASSVGSEPVDAKIRMAQEMPQTATVV